MKPQLLLASASPRRRELLTQIGIQFEVCAVEAEEIPRTGESPENYVHRVAAEKSLLALNNKSFSLPVLAADTEVVLDNEIFGKPADFDQALVMLEKLSGREHLVYSAVSLRTKTEHWQALSLNRVKFRQLNRAEIEAYWNSGEPSGKAGAYAIQGLGAVFIANLEGSFSAVMGLPLFETAQLLRQVGIGVLGY